MKTLSTLIITGLMAFSFIGTAAAQGPVEPGDTTARVAQNLVNQTSGANYSVLTNVTALSQNRSNSAYSTFENQILQTAAQNFAEVSALRGAALGVTLKSFQTMDPKEALAVAKSIASDQSAQTMQMLQALNAGGIANKAQMTVPPVSVPAQAGQ